MKNIFMNSKGQRGTIFAQGLDHIFHLVEKFGAEGYEIHKIN